MRGCGGSAGHEGGRLRLLTALLAAAVVVVVVVGVGAWSSGGWQSGSRPDARDPLAFAYENTVPGRPDLPMTWDPCLPIEIVVNSDAAPPRADQMLREAIAKVNEATGLRLSIMGSTHQRPTPNADLQSGLPGTARAPVLVAWTTPAVIPRLSGTITGVAQPVWRSADSADQGRYIGGAVFLDGPEIAGIARQSDGYARARSVVMHELGHLVGLAHVSNPAEIMSPTMHRDVTEFAPGDLTGLRRLGSGGCPYNVG